MMNTDKSFTYISLLVLVVISVLVSLFYAGVVDPAAEQALQAFGSEAARHPFVIIKDFEQMVCFIVLFWSLFLIGAKMMPIIKDKGIYRIDFLEEIDVSDDAKLDNALNELQSSQYANTPLVQTWIACLLRFKHTQNVQHASEAIQSSIEALSLKLEAGNSMIRYLIWVVPSVGFIGTVRGIGQALAQADKALEGDITGMVDSLGIAFNSTLVALVISILMMFLLHQLQRLQDGLVVDTQTHCETYLLKHLHR
jgi:biopolymer transport protein ExbB/TolQ